MKYIACSLPAERRSFQVHRGRFQLLSEQAPLGYRGATTQSSQPLAPAECV